MKRDIGKFAAAGIICEMLYFISVALFLVTHYEWALTLWEIMTVTGAATLLAVMSAIGGGYGMEPEYRRYMQIALSGTLFLTSAAHFTSIGVIRPLAAQGADIPAHFMIGNFPSIEMTLDYTAWGFFMGAAFLIMFIGIKDRALKIISLICGILCLTGFIGSFFIDFLWYPAPMGYGFGFLIMCIIVMKKRRKS